MYNNGFTIGAGLSYLEAFLNYAFAPFGDLGDVHRISVDLKF
jgi:hypothetical protein